MGEARFVFKLMAQSGYEAQGEYQISPAQWGKIMEILNEPKEGRAALAVDAATMMASRLDAMGLNVCREAAVMLRQMNTPEAAQFMEVEALIKRLESKGLSICNETAILLRQLTPPTVALAMRLMDTDSQLQGKVHAQITKLDTAQTEVNSPN